MKIKNHFGFTPPPNCLRHKLGDGRKEYSKKHNNQCHGYKPLVGGFTLIEMISVIAIIAVLFLVLAISFQSTRKTSRDNQRKSDLGKLSVALGTYYNRKGKFPDEDAGASNECDTSMGSGASCPASGSSWSGSSDLLDLVSEKILNALPVDPANSGKYFYIFELDKAGEGTPPCQSSGNRTCRYILQALLENGIRQDTGQQGECVYTIIGGEGIPNGNISLPTDCAGNVFPSAWTGIPCCK